MVSNREADFDFAKAIDLLDLQEYPLLIYFDNIAQAKLMAEINELRGNNRQFLLDDPEESADLHGTIFALREPQTPLAQRQRHRRPLITFGRSNNADVCLTRSPRQGISSFHFGLMIVNGFWALQHLQGRWSKVNERAVLRQASTWLGLDPNRPNHIQVPGIHLQIYCGDIRLFHINSGPDASIPPLPLMPPPTQSTQTNSIQPDDPILNDEDMYFLCEFVNRPQGLSSWLWLDPWTCTRWIAKPVNSIHVFEQQMPLLKELPDESYIRAERIQVGVTQSWLLTKHRPDIVYLSEIRGDLPSKLLDGRRLLWNLLRLVSRVHKHGFTHGNISLRTVFLQEGDNFELILLGGFSKATKSMQLASLDCKLVFQTVRSYLGEGSPPSQWIGNPILDDLWSKNPEDYTLWPTPLKLCDDIGAHENNERWSTLSLSIQHNLQLMSDDVGDYTMVKSLKPFVAHWLASRGYMNEMPRVVGILNEAVYDGRIYLDAYSRMEKKMKQEGVRVPFLPLVFLESKEVEEEVLFEIPCHARYGIVSLSALVDLAPEGYDLQRLRPFCDPCYEVRGGPMQGLFVPLSQLPALARELSLTHTESASPPPVHPSILQYTRGDWFLLPRNESGVLVPLSHRSNISDDELKRRYGVNTDAPKGRQAEFDLDTLLSRETHMDFRTETSLASADSPDDGGLLFRFSRTDAWLGGLPKKRVRDADMQPDIDGQMPGGVSKKRESADIIPTIFTTK